MSFLFLKLSSVLCHLEHNSAPQSLQCLLPSALETSPAASSPLVFCLLRSLTIQVLEQAQALSQLKIFAHPVLFVLCPCFFLPSLLMASYFSTIKSQSKWLLSPSLLRKKNPVLPGDHWTSRVPVTGFNPDWILLFISISVGSWSYSTFSSGA